MTMPPKYKSVMLETSNINGLAELKEQVTRLVNEEIQRLRIENPSIEVLPQLIPVSKDIAMLINLPVPEEKQTIGVRLLVEEVNRIKAVAKKNKLSVSFICRVFLLAALDEYEK